MFQIAAIRQKVISLYATPLITYQRSLRSALGLSQRDSGIRLPPPMTGVTRHYAIILDLFESRHHLDLYLPCRSPSAF